jgi:hypothetical protein
MSDLRSQKFLMSPSFQQPDYFRMVHTLCKNEGYTPEIARYIDNPMTAALSLINDDEIFVCDESYKGFSNPEILLKEVDNTTSGIMVIWRTDDVSSAMQRVLDTVVKDRFSKDIFTK